VDHNPYGGNSARKSNEGLEEWQQITSLEHKFDINWQKAVIFGKNI